MQNASREEIKKYKAVAVKLKKELSETKDKVQWVGYHHTPL